MSAETLRRAAQQIRIDARIAYNRGHMPKRLFDYNFAVADLLDETAAVYDSGNVAARPRAKAALAIAAAYLDEARP